MIISFPLHPHQYQKYYQKFVFVNIEEKMAYSFHMHLPNFECVAYLFLYLIGLGNLFFLIYRLRKISFVISTVCKYLWQDIGLLYTQ